jgi:hypothetical protein
MVHKLEDKYALDRAAQSWERLAERRERDIEAEPAASQLSLPYIAFGVLLALMPWGVRWLFVQRK